MSETKIAIESALDIAEKYQDCLKRVHQLIVITHTDIKARIADNTAGKEELILTRFIDKLLVALKM